MQSLSLTSSGSLVNRGRRASEDRLKISLLNGNVRMYAVFDGHGGRITSETLQNQLDLVLAQEMRGINVDNPEQMAASIVRAYVRMDSQLASDEVIDGSTAGVVLVTNRHVYLISLGDSKAILYDEGRVLAETRDMKPGDPQEEARIKGLLGWVANSTGIPRVADNLAISRSFGDINLKIKGGLSGYYPDGWISVIPEITVLIRPMKGWLLVASDGLWDVFSPEQVAHFPLSPQKAEQLAALASDRTTDDITIINEML